MVRVGLTLFSIPGVRYVSGVRHFGHYPCMAGTVWSVSISANPIPVDGVLVVRKNTWNIYRGDY